MLARPAHLDDLPALLALQTAWEQDWFGVVESDASEVRESLDLAQPLADRSRLLHDENGRLLAAGLWFSATDSTLLVDPAIDPSAVYDDLLGWFGAARVPVDALGTDQRLSAHLERLGWSPHGSSFELLRAVSTDWVLAVPAWPTGVTLTRMGIDTALLHDLIYRQADWAGVTGHPDRSHEEWTRVLMHDLVPEQQVLAWQDGALVGVALGKVFSDGTGWVSQLAVATPARGQGLGRALLLEALRRRVQAGATQLGLSVSAANANALRLYLDVGLEVQREWRQHLPPT